jgi:hypothetical protein
MTAIMARQLILAFAIDAEVLICEKWSSLPLKLDVESQFWRWPLSNRKEESFNILSYRADTKSTNDDACATVSGFKMSWYESEVINFIFWPWKYVWTYPGIGPFSWTLKPEIIVIRIVSEWTFFVYCHELLIVDCVWCESLQAFISVIYSFIGSGYSDLRV